MSLSFAKKNKPKSIERKKKKYIYVCIYCREIFEMCEQINSEL